MTHLVRGGFTVTFEADTSIRIVEPEPENDLAGHPGYVRLMLGDDITLWPEYDDATPSVAPRIAAIDNLIGGLTMLRERFEALRKQVGP